MGTLYEYMNTFLKEMKTKNLKEIERKTTYNYNRYISARWKIYQIEQNKEKLIQEIC